MNQIRPWLYIGDYHDAQDKNQMDAHGVRAALQLAAPVKLPGIHALYLPVKDLAPIDFQHLKAGVDFALSEKEKGNPILVSCAAGVNRSAAFCVAILKEAEGLTLLQAYKEVHKSRWIAMPQEFAWESLCQYYGEPVSYVEVMRAAAE